VSRLAAGLLFVLLGGAPGDPVSPRFAPRDGEAARVDFERVLRLELVGAERRFTLNGEVVDTEEEPRPRLVLTETETLRYHDEFRVRGGALVGLRRHFEEIGNLYEARLDPAQADAQENETAGASELEGRTVLFTREEASGAFAVELLGEAPEDPELLEGLEARADLSDFLPAEPVEVGQAWAPSPRAFVRMTNLSGDLRVLPEGVPAEEHDTDFARQFDENLDGELSARLVEVVEEGDVHVAVISLGVELRTRVEEAGELEGEETSGVERREHDFDFVLEGELRWDLGRGLARSLRLSGPLRLETASFSAYSAGPRELEIAEVQRFEGRLEFEASVE